MFFRNTGVYGTGKKDVKSINNKDMSEGLHAREGGSGAPGRAERDTGEPECAHARASFPDDPDARPPARKKKTPQDSECRWGSGYDRLTEILVWGYAPAGGRRPLFRVWGYAPTRSR